MSERATKSYRAHLPKEMGASGSITFVKVLKAPEIDAAARTVAAAALEAEALAQAHADAVRIREQAAAAEKVAKAWTAPFKPLIDLAERLAERFIR